jgi:hypothetical protein
MLFFSQDDVLWAVEECERQRVGPMKVHYLLRALRFARLDIFPRKPTLEEISLLGNMVEPDRNPPPSQRLWRKERVTIGGVVPLPPPLHLPRLMEGLLNAWGDMEADEWYREFEEIHPFVDGNGRVGSILWNFKRGSILNLKAPPDFWSESNQEMIEAVTERRHIDMISVLLKGDEKY